MKIFKKFSLLSTVFILAAFSSISACGKTCVSQTAAEMSSTEEASNDKQDSFNIVINTSEKYPSSYKHQNKKGPGITSEDNLINEALPETKAETAISEQTLSAHDILMSKNGYTDKSEIGLSPKWKYAEFSEINTGKAVMHLAKHNRKNKIIGVNAGHGTKGGTSVKTFCHPDKTPKVTGGTTSKGADKAVAVSSGMSFNDGTKESTVTLEAAQILKELLLEHGYDVLMIRDDEDVQLDNIARTVICNNTADCHIALHWDGDGLNKDKGCFYMSVPDEIKYLETVQASWKQSEHLGECLINGLSEQGCKIWNKGKLDMDLTQTSYSFIPSVDIELGNQCSDHSKTTLSNQAQGLVKGIDLFFGF